tara:strand:- start:45160 stop:45432 length:273 start_codon:yes stop_codon:yes gene_type:complete
VEFNPQKLNFSVFRRKFIHQKNHKKTLLCAFSKIENCWPAINPHFSTRKIISKRSPHDHKIPSYVSRFMETVFFNPDAILKLIKKPRHQT